MIFHLETLETDGGIWQYKNGVRAVGIERSITWWYCDYLLSLSGTTLRPCPPVFDTPHGYVFAYANHGRWVADCPAPGCHCSMRISLDDPIFWCVKCRNKAQNGTPMFVRLPFEKTLKEIEIILLMRPNPENRNWKPGETIQSLARENLIHGCARRWW